jgi:hypothetical protein
MSWTEINMCWTGAEGVQLMIDSAIRSDASGSIYGYDGMCLRVRVRVPSTLTLVCGAKRGARGGGYVRMLACFFIAFPLFPVYPPPKHTHTHTTTITHTHTYAGLPVVWVNGTRFSTFEQCSASNAKYQADLIKAVCKASTATPLPPACD